MIRFSAEHRAKVDEKGRVVLNSNLKKIMGSEATNPIVLEKDVYLNCLNIYPETHWNEIVQEMESRLNHFDEGDTELLEQFYENFITVKMADNGRINIPADFLNHARLKKEAIMIGMGKRIRLWDVDEYARRRETRKPLRDMYREKLANKQENDL